MIEAMDKLRDTLGLIGRECGPRGLPRQLAARNLPLCGDWGGDRLGAALDELDLA